MTTEKQLIANQQNALLSTGALTPEGKAITSKNAIKHGIFAKTFIVNHEKYQENALDYQELLNNLIANFNPNGQMEYVLVEKIAIDYWRIRRILKFETDKLYEHIEWALEIRRPCNRIFMQDSETDKVVRYETHLQRQILQNIAMLKQLQVARPPVVREEQIGLVLQSDVNVESR